MTLEQTQAVVDHWVTTVAGGYWTRFQILARLTEELGELSSALQREEGLRPRKQDVDVAGEIGDVLFTLAAFANVSGVNLTEALRKTLEKYDVRDGQAWADSRTAK